MKLYLTTALLVSSIGSACAEPLSADEQAQLQQFGYSTAPLKGWGGSMGPPTIDARWPENQTALPVRGHEAVRHFLAPPPEKWQWMRRRDAEGSELPRPNTPYLHQSLTQP